MTVRTSAKNMNDYFICERCHFIGHGEVIKRGSRMVESIMWSVFLVPGPFYSFWRYISKYLVCPKCKSTEIIPVESVEGQILFNRTLGKK